MKNLIITIMLATMVGLGYAQENTHVIKGSVKDAQSEFPLIGATVTLLNSQPLTGAVTDLDGNFRIEKVPLGRHDLIVSYIGFEDKLIPSVEVTSGKETVLNISLLESLEQMDEVVISGSRFIKGESPNEMAAVSSLSFSVEETGKYAAAFDDPARAALSFPGVKGGGDDIMNEIVIRGNSPRGMLWRMEGIEIPNPNHFGEVGASAGGISMLSNNVIEKTDFYTGAFPAEFGNATSGIMDVHLRSGNNDTREYAFESSVIGIQASAEGPLSKESNSSYLFNYRYSTLTLLNEVINFTGDQESTVFQDLSFKLNFPGNKWGSVSLWGFGGANGQEFNADGEELRFNENWKVKSGAAGLRHLIFLNNNTSIETAFSVTGNLNNWSYDSLNLITYGQEDFVQSSRRLSTTINKKLNASHTIKAGLIYSNLGFDMYSDWFSTTDQSYSVTLDDKGNATRWQGFGQWQFRINEDLTLNSGVHFTSLSLGGQSAVEPRFGLKYNIGNNQSISLGTGLHSRMETVAIYLAQSEINGSDVQINKDLEFSKAAHYVIGWESMARPNTRIRLEAYYQNLFDVPVLASPENDWGQTFSSLNSTDGYTNLDLNNKGTGTNYGIELLAERFFKDGYYYLFTGSLYRSLYTGANEVEHSSRFDGRYLLNALGGKEISLKNNRILALNGRIIWQGANRSTPILLDESMAEQTTVQDWLNPYSSTLKDYFRVDFGISYKVNKPKRTTILSLNVQNITSRLNEYDRYFNTQTNKIDSWDQMGILPVLSYRVLF